MQHMTFPESTPHGDIQEIFPDIFFVQGSIIMAPGIQISRNMIILRSGDSLTLISALRLDESGLRQLEELGKIDNIVRLGAYHLGARNGIDDLFYLNRYDAKLWLLPGMKSPDHVEVNLLGPELPFSNASLFVYETSKMPEGLILVEQEGGVIIAADSLQNWEVADAFFSETAATQMQKAGFICRANIGPEWFRQCQPKNSDFQRVANLQFAHLIPSHGTPIKNTAKEEIIARFKTALDI